ncbi:uncharacterized protein N7496_012458 [Penicillium cataractarum]|uniref:DUF7587 domain-containing protein n=1 Tax=Penicillium cataractarum TaxID=2100454 RepID=A0A9W9R7W1_9EURO|nr:uncharacterized protein N7496_012458 [Penicillium cataractarum]KAJ5355246.1 hypothetical protein N7496_012458 [Penicillium cataractarum]
MDNITESIRNVHLGDVPEESEQLLFSPHPDSGVAESVLDNVPRYLFRVATPESDGITNETWVRSEAALRDRGASLEDIFFHLDTKKRTEVAKILNLHLQWQTKNDLLDNFVSWTSSLLFAIQYIYYRHHKDNTPLEDIKLFVVDTTMFPRGIFMRDLDLIDIFCESNTRLNDFRSLRNGGTYYFGEYFSQGSLKIEDKCQLIPAQVIFEQDRLRRIQPRFAPISSKASEWAKPVVRLRRNIYLRPSLVSLTSTEMRDRLQAIEEIMPHISASWRFPIAVYFAGLIGAETSLSDQEVGDDNLFFAYFHSGTFGWRLGHAEFIIRTLHTESLSPENGHGFVAPDLNPMLARAGQEVLSKLGRVETMCNELAEVISIV